MHQGHLNTVNDVHYIQCKGDQPSCSFYREGPHNKFCIFNYMAGEELMCCNFKVTLALTIKKGSKI